VNVFGRRSSSQLGIQWRSSLTPWQGCDYGRGYVSCQGHGGSEPSDLCARPAALGFGGACPAGAESGSARPSGAESDGIVTAMLGR
jgi:hypothetical protein